MAQDVLDGFRARGEVARQDRERRHASFASDPPEVRLRRLLLEAAEIETEARAAQAEQQYRTARRVGDPYQAQDAELAERTRMRRDVVREDLPVVKGITSTPRYTTGGFTEARQAAEQLRDPNADALAQAQRTTAMQDPRVLAAGITSDASVRAAEARAKGTVDAARASRQPRIQQIRGVDTAGKPVTRLVDIDSQKVLAEFPAGLSAEDLLIKLEAESRARAAGTAQGKQDVGDGGWMSSIANLFGGGDDVAEPATATTPSAAPQDVPPAIGQLLAKEPDGRYEIDNGDGSRSVWEKLGPKISRVK